jgi:hypothetical protein
MEPSLKSGFIVTSIIGTDNIKNEIERTNIEDKIFTFISSILVIMIPYSIRKESYV